MRADFVNEVARNLDIKRKDLIEKDLILHQILLDLSGDRFFTANVLFKGGTCLIKSYFGYSEILRGHRLHMERPGRVQRNVAEGYPGLLIQSH